jgi:predicted transposase YbfD/YdcC
MVLVTRIRDSFDTRSKTWKTSTEEAFFVTTFTSSAAQYGKIIQNHWGIENKRHHVLDKTFHEDASRIRVNPFCVAKIRTFALDICRVNDIKNVAIALYENSLKPLEILNWKGIST